MSLHERFAAQLWKAEPLLEGLGSEDRHLPLWWPLDVIVAGANRNDMKLVETTLDHLMIARPAPTEEKPQHLCLDAGYDYDAVYETVRAHHYVPHIRPNLHMGP